MSPEQAKDYATLKSVLLFKYQRTADGFRTKFRNARCENSETYSRFLEGLKGYLSRWIELSVTPETFKGLIDLLLRESKC